jgi:phosphohistidine swiveling domain-containing protein
MIDAESSLAGSMAMNLSDVSLKDAPRVGTKAANLGSLTRAGFPVPDGMILPTDVRVRYQKAGMAGDGELGALLEAVAASLGGTPMAVRSSGVPEDLPDASFAGQYETVLDVEGASELEEAVRQCWDSTSGARAEAYRESHGLSSGGMAVLIQRMVDADAAGVAFTANPVTGSRHEVVVNAVPGLGDKLVSGEVSPDEWIVNADGARSVSSPHGVIDATQAEFLAEVSRSVETHFGAPQDIEWAISDDNVFVLQARPITALPEQPIEPAPVDLEIPPGFWFFDPSHAPSVHVPIDRFLLTLVRPASAQWSRDFGYLIDGIEFREIGGWPYQRMVPLGDREGPALPSWMMRLLVRTVPTLRRRVARAVDTVRSDKPGRYIARWYDEWQPEMAEEIARLRDVDLATLSDGELRSHIDSAQALMAKGLLIHMFLHGALAPILFELVTTCDELLNWDAAKTMDLVSGTSRKSTEPARRLKELADMARERPQIVRLLEDVTPATAASLEAADQEFAAHFAAFLHEYGCRELGHTTMGEATLAERPNLVLGMLAGQIRQEYDPKEDQGKNAIKRAETLKEAEAQLADHPDQIQRLRRVVDRAERAYPIREDNEFYCFSSPLALLRYSALEMGHRLAGRGVLDKSEDVLYLEFDEALTALSGDSDLRPLVERRKGEFAWIEQNPGPPHYGEPPPGPPSFEFLPAEARLLMEALIWSNELIMAVDEDGGSAGTATDALTGIAASAGTYTGPVRVVMTETEFEKIQPGDVLVCPITSPVWSILFSMVGALVTDTGGILSHPAIIAREYQVPAVVATGDATSHLKDGQRVTVDGTKGTVVPV